jgi:trimeric autotransporter adhesin
MNNKTLPIIATVCLLAVNTVFAQSSLFTYQGTLNTNGLPYSGSAEFQFTLWDAATNGNSVATNNPASIIATVVNGLFTVTLDFGITPFNGDPRFLQTDVRTTIGPFTTLTPRQPLTATPYAMRALNLTTNGLVSGTYGNALTFNNAGNSFAGSFDGTFSGNGSTISNVNAITLGGVPANGFWTTTGNAGANPTNGAFIGTTDNLPFEIRVNNQRVFRLEMNANVPNIIGGFASNTIDPGVVGSTIGGGGSFSGPNRISENLATIGGGGQNTNQGRFATIAGGANNNILQNGFSFATIGGGNLNSIGSNANYTVIGGGQQNVIGHDSLHATIGGGHLNAISANSSFATIPGGDNNTATNNAFAAGHRAKAVNQGTFVWADSQNIDFASTATNQFLIRASGGVGINTTSPTRDVEVQNSGDVELGLQSKDTGGHLWTLQSSSVSGSANLDASFQIIDRTFNSARLFIGTNGNVGIGTSNPTNRLHVVGGITCTALVQTSDRNAKENFAPISPDEVLAKVAALPISSWTYKEMRDGRHLGPMAQDFYAAFQLGGSDTTITAVDTEGVALAAIQGLNQKLGQELKTKDSEIAELKTRLQKLEAFAEKMAGETK